MEEANRLLGTGRLEESRELLTAFIESQGDSTEHRAAVTDAYNTRGQVKYLGVDFPGAIADYSCALERDPQFAVAWYNRGQVRYRLGRYKEAERDLQRCLELKPGFTDAQLNLAQVQRDLKNGHSFNTH